MNCMMKPRTPNESNSAHCLSEGGQGKVRAPAAQCQVPEPISSDSGADDGYTRWQNGLPRLMDVRRFPIHRIVVNAPDASSTPSMATPYRPKTALPSVGVSSSTSRCVPGWSWQACRS